MYSLTGTINYPTIELSIHNNERKLDLEELHKIMNVLLLDPAATSFVFVVAKHPKED